MLKTNYVHLGDCLAYLRTLPDNSIDAMISDPPYGLGTKDPTAEEIDAYLVGARLDTGGDFMSHKWDIPTVEIFKECFRVLKPGAPIMCFAGTRTFDLMQAGMLAAGFVLEGSLSEKFGNTGLLSWCHGQGFPKSLNISKAIDKAKGITPKVVGHYTVGGNALTPTALKGGTFGVGVPNSPSGELDITEAVSDEAKKWEGWGTALKPAWEPIITLRKPGPILSLPGFDTPFYYCAKTSGAEANAGLDESGVTNTHPTKKALNLMEWLVAGASLPGSLVIDPYCGGGTTCVAAANLGREFIGCEISEVFHKIAQARSEYAVKNSSAGQAETLDLLFGGGLFDDGPGEPGVLKAIPQEASSLNACGEAPLGFETPACVETPLAAEPVQIEAVQPEQGPVLPGVRAKKAPEVPAVEAPVVIPSKAANYAAIRDVLEGKSQWCVVQADAFDVLKQMASDSVDHIITDPPYDAHTHENARAFDKDSLEGQAIPIDFPPIEPAAIVPDFLRVAKRWILSFCAFEQIRDYRDAATQKRWIRTGVYHRPNGSPQFSGDRPAQAAEGVAIMHRDGMEAEVEGVAIMHREGKKSWNGGGSRAFWSYQVERKRRHPTQKPLGLMVQLIREFTNPGDLVFDPFCGSGTTGAAAILEGRRFIGVEMQEKHVVTAREVITEAVEQVRADTAMKANMSFLYGDGSDENGGE